MSLIRKASIFVSVCLLISCVVKADSPKPDYMPLGAYLSWEIPNGIAAGDQEERWRVVEQILDQCTAHNIDTLWVTNLPSASLGRLISLCEKKDMKLLVSLGEIEAKLKARWTNGDKYYQNVVPKVVELAGDSKALVGWVLSDEPLEDDLENLERLRQIFAKHDPNRFTLTVSMWPQTPSVPKKTQLPVVCTDLYPFFGPNDPNGPHTDHTSQSFYRNNIARMIAAIGKKPSVPWVMAQCFVEIWGPYKYNRNNDIISLPGSYFHWRTPTKAEMRWQIWEAVRSGCKGIFFFQLPPIQYKRADTNKLKSPNVSWKNALLKKPMNAGPGGLLRWDLSATSQMKELGTAYERIAPYRNVIFRWKPLKGQRIADIDRPVSWSEFAVPETSDTYLVLVNNDLNKPQSVSFSVPTSISQIIDEQGKKLPLMQSFPNSPRRYARVTLEAGDGVILRYLVSKQKSE